jgi:hypothetical protein
VSGGRSISLEIYGLKGGRWNIHANYTVQEREECLEDAKELDDKGRFEAVCVVRETYSQDSNTARQAIIYHSPTLSSPPPVAAVMAKEATASKPAAATPQKNPRNQKVRGEKKAKAKKNRKREPKVTHLKMMRNLR